MYYHENCLWPDGHRSPLPFVRVHSSELLLLSRIDILRFISGYGTSSILTVDDAKRTYRKTWYRVLCASVVFRELSCLWSIFSPPSRCAHFSLGPLPLHTMISTRLWHLRKILYPKRLKTSVGNIFPFVFIHIMHLFISTQWRSLVVRSPIIPLYSYW